MFLKEFFYMTRADRRTFICLCSLALVAIIFFGAVSLTDDTSNKIEERKETATVKDESHESADGQGYAVEETNKGSKLFYFDPNTADSTQLLQLGLRPWQVRNIYKYRARGGVYQCKENFAYVYGLTVKDYKRLEPYIRIGADYLPASSLAEVRNHKRGYERSSRYASDNGENVPNVEHKAYTPKIRIGEHIEINGADTTELMKIPGIGSYYSRQIVRYRNQLGGFVSKEQLLEIEGFPEDAVKYISIDESIIRRLRINQLTLSQLKRHPYLNYYQARAISDYRRLRGNIRSISELKLMKEFSSHDIERIGPYIEY